MAKTKDELRFTLRIPRDLLQRFAELANRHHRSINNEIVALIEKALDDDKPAKGKAK